MTPSDAPGDRRRGGPRWLALPTWCVLALSALNARAEDRIVNAPEAVVRSAPFDVAPEIERLRAGDHLQADDQPQGNWRRVALSGGRYGYVRETDTEGAPQAAPIPGASQPTSPRSSSGPPMPVAAQRAVAGGSAAGPNLLGVMFELLPVGTLSGSSSGGASVSSDSVFAVAVAPFIDATLSPYFTLGLSPQIVFRVKGDGDMNESAKELDLRARLTGRLPLSPRVRVFARLSPAYSIIFLPSTPTTTTSSTSAPSDPNGIAVDFAVGTEIAVLPNLFVVTDLGYQSGFQSSSAGDLRTSYLHLGAGFAIGL